MQQHLPFFRLHTLAKLPHCKLSPPHLRWLLAAPACGAIDSNISAADSVTISIRMIWLPSALTSQAVMNSPPHSITSSAVARSDGGMVSPVAFAVFILITSLYLVGACTGRSDG